MEATALVGHVLGRDRAGVLARLSDRLRPEEAESLTELLQRRVRDRVPLQYLLGRASFLDFEVDVGPGVFIPRPETEQVVERALEVWEPDHPWALDACTGSGAIAIAIARARPEARIVATDVSPVALRVAAANARRLGVASRIALLRADLTGCLRNGRYWPGELGLLVCNPPYAPRDDVTQPEVRNHEPEIAWTPGPEGTEIYRRLIPAARRLLAPGRPLVLELGWGQERSVPELLSVTGGWDPPRIDPDFQGIPRVLSTFRS